MSSTSFSYQVSNLLEKMSSPDKDYRFMATNDLMSELQKDSITLDDDTERKVVKTLLKLLEDKNGEVQNLAVRCLAPLVHKIKAQQLETMVDTLCSNMESQNDQLRDVSSIALKTVMAELPGGASSSSVLCVKRVLPRLTEGLCVESKTDASVKLEILDILSNLIFRFGRSFGLNFEEIDKAIFLQLEKERQALRKRSIHALGFLVDVVSNEHYDKIVQKILTGCAENAKNSNNLRTYVSAATGICKSSSARFAHFLPQFVPQFLVFCKEVDDDELKEACLQAFETFIYRCTKDMIPFLDQIVEINSQFIKYDPNYHYDEEETNGNMMETDDGTNGHDEDEEDDEGDGDEYSDDDDLSWKVRRAAAKCVEALITYHPSRLPEHYRVLGPLLINRFKEREDNVKYDIFQAYTALLKQTRQLLPETFHHSQQTLNSSSDSANDHISLTLFSKFVDEELSPDQHKVFEILSGQSGTLVRAIHSQLKGKNLKTRQHCFVLLSHLLKALPGALANYFQLLVGPIQTTLNDKCADGNMKITALHFVVVAMRTHDPKTLTPFINALTPLIVKAVQDPSTK
uniref:DUF3385 domain-containing protein n=1 Tax=Ditylenchus dipsaci TaxID=166011 RepID=A0A915D6E3_9BILA